jgi:hypothetical protein
VLFGVSDIEAALMAHRVLAFEQRALKVLSDHSPAQANELPSSGDVLPFRRPA